MTESIARKDCPGNGISARQLEGVRWRRVTHGRYVPATEVDDLAHRARAVAPELPAGAGYSHLTAAALYGLWLPPLPRWLPMLATTQPFDLRPERRGLYVARSRAALPEPLVVDGVPLLAPELVVAQLAEDFQLLDLVAAIDSALHLRLCSEEAILAGLRARQRGLPRLRRALVLADGRSESPWESWLRLLHVLCGIEVEPQHLVRDDNGIVVARADLRIRGTKRLPEYDGADHRDKARHHRDLRREKQLTRLGYERFGYVSPEIIGDARRIVRDAESALGIRHKPDRLKPG